MNSRHVVSIRKIMDVGVGMKMPKMCEFQTKMSIIRRKLQGFKQVGICLI